MEKFEISHFQAVHCVRENAVSPKVFTRFSKTFLLLKDVENRYLAEKFHGRSYLSFAMVGWKLFSGGLKVGNFEFFHQKKFSSYHCKTKIAGPMKFFARIPIFHIFQRMESFWKSAEYLWWYSIFCDTEYRLKVGNFEFFHQKKVFILPLQN